MLLNKIFNLYWRKIEFYLLNNQNDPVNESRAMTLKSFEFLPKDYQKISGVDLNSKFSEKCAQPKIARMAKVYR